MQRSLLAKGETMCNFARKFAISERARFFYMPQSWDRLFYFPSEGRHAVDFSKWKNLTVSVGSEPAILGTRGQHANH
jgi:hypothetical protein